MQQYLDLTDIAARWGVKPATVRRYRHEGRLPPCDAVIGIAAQHPREGWLPETVDAIERPGPGARTDLRRRESEHP